MYHSLITVTIIINLESGINQGKSFQKQILLEKHTKGFLEVFLGNSSLLTHPHRHPEHTGVQKVYSTYEEEVTCEEVTFAVGLPLS